MLQMFCVCILCVIFVLFAMFCSFFFPLERFGKGEGWAALSINLNGVLCVCLEIQYYYGIKFHRQQEKLYQLSCCGMGILR